MIIQVYYDPNGFRGWRRGCYRARLKNRPSIHDAGLTADEAVNEFLITAKTFGYSGEKADYEIEVMP